jgi:hypothetical protein
MFMTDAFWTTLVASLVSASAALGGVSLTNKHTYRRQRHEMQEKALGQQREIVADIVLTGRNWASRQEVLIPAYSKMSNSDLLEFAQTDTTKTMGEIVDRLNMALVKADLFIPTSSALREDITWLADFVNAHAENVIGPVMKNRGDFEQVLSSLRQIYTFRNRLLVTSKHATGVLGVQDFVASEKEKKPRKNPRAALTAFLRRKRDCKKNGV